MTPRALLAATLLAGGLTATPATAAPPALAGTTVVSGSAVGAMKVRVPRDATISLLATAGRSQGRAATFRGKGRLLAAGLVRTRGLDEVWLLSQHVCMDRGCAVERRFGGVHLDNGKAPRTDAPLRAGTYTLYWVADGAPASVTLRITGLAGRTALRPPPLRAAEWGPALVHDGVDPVTSTGARTYESTTEVAMPGRGFVLGTQWLMAKNMLSETTLCLTTAADRVSPDPMHPCRTTTGDGFGWTTSMRCLCVIDTFQNELAVASWIPVDRGTYTVRFAARYTGTFGRTGLVAVALPYL